MSLSAEKNVKAPITRVFTKAAGFGVSKVDLAARGQLKGPHPQIIIIVSLGCGPLGLGFPPKIDKSCPTNPTNNKTELPGYRPD